MTVTRLPPPPATDLEAVFWSEGVERDVAAQLRTIRTRRETELGFVEYRLTQEQQENALAVMGAWWTMDGVSMLTHAQALGIALKLALR